VVNGQFKLSGADNRSAVWTMAVDRIDFSARGVERFMATDGMG
jgi:hypothetical protein